MASRQIFSQGERLYLEKLIAKHLSGHKPSTNPDVKRKAWELITEDYNAVNANKVRKTFKLPTVSLQKCRNMLILSLSFPENITTAKKMLGQHKN